jgi:hypothetical protein
MAPAPAPATGHTPGPWHVGGAIDSVIFAPDGYAIADAKTFHGRRQNDMHANARLIASAPDLLAALQQCLVIVDAHRRAAGGEGDVAAMNARAAIARATGEQS